MKTTHKWYIRFFATASLYKFHEFLFRLSLRGMGILNGNDFNTNGEKSFLNSYLAGKTGVVLDVGANIGNYTASVLSINPELQVHAFEPHPKTFIKLTERFQDHSRVQVHQYGVSRSDGQLNLYDYPTKDGSAHASMYAQVIEEIHGAVQSIHHTVDVITIDQFMTKNQIDQVTLLKIDTEGNELEVLYGAFESLKSGKIRAIQFEFNEMNIASRSRFKDFVDLLDGFTLYRILPHELYEIKSYKVMYHEIYACHNVVAISNT
jgi:FkbM family methyltransferase